MLVLAGPHTLTRGSYQVVYIADGVMGAEEREASKIIAGLPPTAPLQRSTALPMA